MNGWRRWRLPPKLLLLICYRNTLGDSLHRLHLFFSTFFLLSKIIMNNNNIIIIKMC
jgi:hypothetical protein